jgi:metacaspase-1
MPNGYSLHIGLNAVDPDHYNGWSGPLNACESDARAMKNIADSMGYESMTLLTKDATRENLFMAAEGIKAKVKEGDILFMSYSGHGGQLPDYSGDETDNMDETWCLYDCELVDDEIYEILAGFPIGVRIIMLSDSCHSGTVIKMANFSYRQALEQSTAMPRGRQSIGVRAMPADIALGVYEKNRDFYAPKLKAIHERGPEKRYSRNVDASVILISGCQDNQYSYDGTFNGLFTGTLLRVWANGRFRGDYLDLLHSIVNQMPPEQTPNFYPLGRNTDQFVVQKPFSISELVYGAAMSE